MKDKDHAAPRKRSGAAFLPLCLLSLCDPTTPAFPPLPSLSSVSQQRAQPWRWCTNSICADCTSRLVRRGNGGRGRNGVGLAVVEVRREEGPTAGPASSPRVRRGCLRIEEGIRQINGLETSPYKRPISHLRPLLLPFLSEYEPRPRGCLWIALRSRSGDIVSQNSFIYCKW
jgi:hypothetical protein